METTVVQSTEYRDLPLALLSESTTTPRRVFEDEALKERAIPNQAINSIPLSLTRGRVVLREHLEQR